MNIFGALAGKKTYITAGLGVLGAMAGVLTGGVSYFEAAQLILTSVLGATVRHGVDGAAAGGDADSAAGGANGGA
ncbi:hypothetical protein CPter291_2629 [Collimonas pratensis]|uniref:Lipoprotein n=1 Tax=Collimonas pratensis TaxID=279113 RepID=A0ABN4MAM1_9BURK|nr:hypothetical protein CPter291_2629 [Collimonas pratensis]